MTILNALHAMTGRL